MARSKTAGLSAADKAAQKTIQDVETVKTLGDALREGKQAPAFDLDALEARANVIVSDQITVSSHQRRVGGWYSTQPNSDEWRKLCERGVTFYRCGHKGDPMAEGRAAMLRSYGYFDVPSHVHLSGFELTHQRDINLGALPQTVEIVDRKRSAKKRGIRDKALGDFQTLGGAANRGGIESQVFGSEGVVSGGDANQAIAQAQREARAEATRALK